MAKRPADEAEETQSEPAEEGDNGLVSYTAVLLSQGSHRFYTLAMPSQMLAETCVVDPRDENPLSGFQRVLDRRRAQDIAEYIDKGLGTIPGSIVLSAQPEAELEYVRKARTIRFKKTPRSFLIIDGQHRVFGFKMAKETLRVPVVIYNKLTRAEEARLFMDINTKQRPVPPELILDIKRLAETENDIEALLTDVFDAFNTDGNSPLFALLSPSEKSAGKISRVTFNQALKPIWSTFSDSDAQSVYVVLSAYLHACLAGLRGHGAADRITNPTLIKALMLTFPNVAQRVADRFEGEYTIANFEKVLAPLFRNTKKADFQKPGASHKALHETFRKALSSGFSLGKAVL
ncbi:DGQHR domain-containing protein [Mesorhizobium sp. B1-1-1]|uniref:DGQHR domain-containing protein n=1 Tax=Mesorhizobium sp. B1-1-1 TaxID=2589983 RepID=UPI0011279EFF|nr:DGQHR domain-containing protein [Mesorhizobium sp. B1-1-1]TPN61711.1 DGQHR domain-containing protein [Mesorhizobium sp. B1-1-1]